MKQENPEFLWEMFKIGKKLQRVRQHKKGHVMVCKTPMSHLKQLQYPESKNRPM